MEGLITAVTGPLGALALSVAIIVYLAKEIVPALKAYFDAQTAQLASLVAALEKTVAAHEADRSAFERSIERLGSRLEKVENDITAIAAKLH